MLNMVRAAMGDDYNEGTGVTTIKYNKVTAWNDSLVRKPDHERSHMVQTSVQMVCGFGVNANTKKAWNGVDLEGIRVNERETKKHLRVIKYNEEKSTIFEAPQFDTEKGTYDFSEVHGSFYDDIENPLIPVNKQKARKLFIR